MEDPIVQVKRQELEQAMQFAKAKSSNTNHQKTEQLQKNLLELQKVSLHALSKEQRYE